MDYILYGRDETRQALPRYYYKRSVSTYFFKNRIWKQINYFFFKQLQIISLKERYDVREYFTLNSYTQLYYVSLMIMFYTKNSYMNFIITMLQIRFAINKVFLSVFGRKEYGVGLHKSHMAYFKSVSSVLLYFIAIFLKLVYEFLVHLLVRLTILLATSQIYEYMFYQTVDIFGGYSSFRQSRQLLGFYVYWFVAVNSCMNRYNIKFY